MIVRPERPADADAIRAVNLAAFPTPLEADLVDALRDHGHLIVSLLAEEDGEVVGHVAFSLVATAGDDMGAGLAPVAVLEARRRQGIGTRLIEAGLLVCREFGIGWVVVLGDPDYYARFGFVPASRFGLADEYGGGEAFQALELTPGCMPTGAGTVRYAEEFAAFE